MQELIGMILGGLAVLGLVCIGGVLWMRKRRMDQALAEAARRGGGGPRPELPQ